MVLNPLNPAYCAGDGIAVDGLGRPTWKLEFAGSATSGTGVGTFGGPHPAVAVAGTLLPITNTTSRTRALVAEINEQHVHLNIRAPWQPGVWVHWSYNINGSGWVFYRLQTYEFITAVFKTTGPNKYLFLNVPPGPFTIHAEVNVTLQFEGVVDVAASPVNITAYWLGG